MLHRLLAVSLAVLPLLAQEAPPAKPASIPARAFFVDDAAVFLQADLAGMRKAGVWDDLAVSALKIAFVEIEKNLGTKLDALDRFTLLMADGDAGTHSEKRIMIVEGNREVPVPEAVRGGGFWEREARQDGVEAWRAGHGMWFVRPSPTVTVEGHEELVEPVLAGKPWSDRRTPDVMSLLSGKRQRAAGFVMDLSMDGGRLRRDVLRDLFPGCEWPEDDEPAFFAVHVLITGDADDPHLVFEGVMRHAKSGAGVQATLAAAGELQKRAMAMPAMRGAKKALASAALRIDGTDAIASIDLGRSRDAVGMLATLIAPMFVGLVSREQLQAVQQAQVVEEPPPPPPPEAKKEEPKKEAPPR